MSEVAHATSAWPLALTTIRTVMAACHASQMPVAMPQPTRSPPSRIERGSGIALVPAERLGALAVAFPQCFAAERLINVLIAIGIAAQAKFERIDLERNRKLIHRAFKRIDAGRAAWAAHIARCRKVELGELMRVIWRWRMYRVLPTNRSLAGCSLRIATSR